MTTTISLCEIPDESLIVSMGLLSPIDQLHVPQIDESLLRDERARVCVRGMKKVLARGETLNALTLVDEIGPEHREYMAHCFSQTYAALIAGGAMKTLIQRSRKKRAHELLELAKASDSEEAAQLLEDAKALMLVPDDGPLPGASEGLQEMYDTLNEAWGVAPNYARVLMRTMPEAKRIKTRGGLQVWVVPVGTPKPTQNLSELKRHGSEV